MAVPCVDRGPCGGADYIGGCGRGILGPKAAQLVRLELLARRCGFEGKEEPRGGRRSGDVLHEALVAWPLVNASDVHGGL